MNEGQKHRLIGARVCVLAGRNRGKFGYVGGVIKGRNDREQVILLVTDTKATESFEWWQEVEEHDVSDHIK